MWLNIDQYRPEITSQDPWAHLKTFTGLRKHIQGAKLEKDVKRLSKEIKNLLKRISQTDSEVMSELCGDSNSEAENDSLSESTKESVTDSLHIILFIFPSMWAFSYSQNKKKKLPNQLSQNK